MKKALLIIAALVLLVPVALTACSSGGIAQADYDAIVAQLADARTQMNQAQADLTKAQEDATKAQADKTAAETNFQSAEANIKQLEQQLADLKAKEDSVGATTTEIVAKIVKSYNENHAYQQNIYDCNNFASDVWDMLQKLNISSVIVIGSRDVTLDNILNTDHAWLLVDVGGGQKLAFDPVSGTSITQAENPHYYQGWTFNTPADLKANDDLRAQYNAGVTFRNTLAAEVNAAMALYNNSTSETEADKYMALYTKLKELKDAQEAALANLMAQINGLATKL